MHRFLVGHAHWLALPLAMLLAGCHEERDRLREDEVAWRARNGELEKELREKDALLKVTQGNTGELQRILDLTRVSEQETLLRIATLEAEIAKLRRGNELASTENAGLAATLETQAVMIELLRRRFRESVAGLKLGDLILRDGRSLTGAVVLEMPSDEEVRLQHAAGVAVFAIADLPEAARQSLLHAPDVANMTVDPKALLAGAPVTPDEHQREARLKAQAQAMAAAREAQEAARRKQEREQLRVDTLRQIKELEQRMDAARLALNAARRLRDSQAGGSGRIRVSPVDQAKAAEKYERERSQHEAALLLYESRINDLKATLETLPPP